MAQNTLTLRKFKQQLQRQLHAEPHNARVFKQYFNKLAASVNRSSSARFDSGNMPNIALKGGTADKKIYNCTVHLKKNGGKWELDDTNPTTCTPPKAGI